VIGLFIYRDIATTNTAIELMTSFPARMGEM
jgi:hypothetical protein